MKKDLKKTAIFAALVFSFLAFVTYEINKFQKEEEVKETKSRVVKLPSEKIDRVEFGDFVFEKSKGNVWRSVGGDFKDILKSEKVNKWLLESLSQDGRALSEPDEDIDWSKFGFTQDSKEITFKIGGDYTTVTLSPKRSFEGGVYLKVNTGKNSTILYSSTKDWFEFFNKDLGLLRDMSAFDWSPIDDGGFIKSVKVSKDRKDFGLVFKGDKWSSDTRKYKKWTFDRSKIATYLDDVKGFLLKGFVEDRPKNLKSYGELKIESSENTHKFKVFEQDDNYYAESSFRKGILFDLGKDNVDTFFASAWDLRSFDDALSFNQDKVNKLSFQLGKKEYKLSKNEEGEWSFEGELPEGQVFNGASVQKLFTLMKSVQGERYLSSKPDVNKPKLQITYRSSDKSSNNFVFYNLETPCIKGDKKNKACRVLGANDLYMVVKKEAIDPFEQLEFLKEQNIKKAEVETDENIKAKTDDENEA